MIITIDGPTASGKSTVAQMLADAHNMYHINSGLLYRALAYLLMRDAGYTHDTLLTVSDADVSVCADPKRLVYEYAPRVGARILFDGVDITPELKKAGIDACASILSSVALVRVHVDAMQRHIAKLHSVVVDGRDAGSVVFPNADYRFFLTASLTVRARRWQHMQEHKGNMYSLEHAEQEISVRDHRDSTRAVAPLIVPKNAIVIDSSELTVQQTVDVMAAYIKK